MTPHQPHTISNSFQQSIDVQYHLRWRMHRVSSLFLFLLYCITTIVYTPTEVAASRVNDPPPPSSGETVYVLQLQNGKYYVGKSRDLNRRVEQHRLGQGSEWTRQHSMIKVIETIPNAPPFEEERKVKQLMQKYGIDNVRGAQYSQKQLSPEQVRELKQSVGHEKGNCFICGKPGHFARNCPHSANYRDHSNNDDGGGEYDEEDEYDDDDYDYDYDDHDSDEEYYDYRYSHRYDDEL